MTRYAYDTRDLIAEPESYMFSATSLTAYIEARGNTLRKLREKLETKTNEGPWPLPTWAVRELPRWAQLHAVATEPARDGRSEDLQEILKQHTRQDAWDTATALDLLLSEVGAVDKSSRSPTSDRIWRLLRRRFEVNKRVWSHYTARFRPASKDGTQFALYAGLAAGLSCLWREGHDLRDLNALLKLNDTISSVVGQLNEPRTIFLATVALHTELKAIRDLLKA